MTLKGESNGRKYFTMSTQKWPNKFMYMQNTSDSNVRGWVGDPGPAGHFYFTKAN